MRSQKSAKGSATLDHRREEARGRQRPQPDGTLSPARCVHGKAVHGVFPRAHLLYASDTLALNDDGSLYDPELMSEVAQAVKRENLIVDTVFAMHQGPMPWNQVIDADRQVAAAPRRRPSRRPEHRPWSGFKRV